MEGAFTHLGNHLISDSASAINADDDLSAIDPDESLLEGEFGRNPRLPGPPKRRRHDDDDDQTQVFGDDDAESMAGLAVVDKQKKERSAKAEDEKELPRHACAYVTSLDSLLPYHRMLQNITAVIGAAKGRMDLELIEEMI